MVNTCHSTVRLKSTLTTSTAIYLYVSSSSPKFYVYVVAKYCEYQFPDYQKLTSGVKILPSTQCIINDTMRYH